MWDFSSLVNTNLEQKPVPWIYTDSKHWTMPSSKDASHVHLMQKSRWGTPSLPLLIQGQALIALGYFFLILRTFRNDLGLRQPSLEMDVGLTMHMGLIAMCDRPFRSNCRNVMFTHGKGTMMSLECAKQFVSMILAMVSVFLSQPRGQESGWLSLLILLLSLEYSCPAN